MRLIEESALNICYTHLDTNTQHTSLNSFKKLEVSVSGELNAAELQTYSMALALQSKHSNMSFISKLN